MKVSEQNMVGFKTRAFNWLGLFDFNNHRCGFKNSVRIGKNGGANLLISFIGNADARTSLGFNENAMASIDQLSHGARRCANTVFLWLNLFRNTNFHFTLQLEQSCLGPALFAQFWAQHPRQNATTGAIAVPRILARQTGSC